MWNKGIDFVATQLSSYNRLAPDRFLAHRKRESTVKRLAQLGKLTQNCQDDESTLVHCAHR
jgi:hypothetical protein